MTNEPEKRGNVTPIEVGIGISSNSVSINAKTRLTTALDRLIGLGLDTINSKYEHRLRLKEIEQKKLEEISIIKADTEITLAKMREQAILKRENQKQLNRENVVYEALESLENSSKEDVSSDLENISDEWLNYFGEISEKASTDSVVQLWGKILSGEIKRPGSYSIKTLRFISELDQHVAALFEKYKDDIIYGDIIIKGDGISGEKFADLSILEEAELLTGVTGNIHRTFSTDKNFVYPPFPKVGDFVIIGELQSELKVGIIKLTKTARELIHLLPSGDHVAALKTLTVHLIPIASTLSINRVNELITLNEQLHIKFDTIEFIK